MNAGQIHAFIAVWRRDPCTFYVRRSMKMQNYPGVWSLLSTQFDPSTFDDVYDFEVPQRLFEDMASKRLSGVEISVKKYLSSASCTQNPMRKRVVLHMYEVELEREPELNADFYSESAWMTPDEYRHHATGATCGLCMRMWSDYSVHRGLTETPFAAPVSVQS